MYNEQQQKEIAEMAEFIHGRRDKNGSLKTAQALYDKGYRKVDEKTRQYLECIPEMKKAFDKVAAEAVNKFAKEVKKEANRCYEYTCNILSECKAGYDVECNNGFEPKNDYADEDF